MKKLKLFLRRLWRIGSTFLICFFVTVIAVPLVFPHWSEVTQTSLILGVPAALTWVQEKWRIRGRKTRDSAAANPDSLVAQTDAAARRLAQKKDKATAQQKPLATGRTSTSRIASGKKTAEMLQRYEANKLRNSQPQLHQIEPETRAHSDEGPRSRSNPSNTPPRNDYSEIVRVGKLAAPSLAKSAGEYQKKVVAGPEDRRSDNKEPLPVKEPAFRNQAETPTRYKPPKNDYAKIMKAVRAAAGQGQNVQRHKATRKAAPKRSQSAKDGWVPANETATVAGRDIGGMVFVGTPPSVSSYGYRDKCRAFIDPSLAVARTGDDKAGEGMPYWPGYSEISSRCRATYLDWLEDGRRDATYDPGYMFLYFYGLERRFFVDKSQTDATDIVQEVRRLMALYGDNHSARRYLGEFLDFAMLADTDLDEMEPVFERRGWELPFSVKYAIGARIDRGENLSAYWLLSWFMCHPESNLRTPATRCRAEFMALFRLRFADRFPDGLKVNKPRKTLTASYAAASSEFEVSINPTSDGKPVPDISGLRKPVTIAQDIADAAMDELDKMSRFLGRNPTGRGSVEAHALLPTDLWDAFPSEEMDQLQSWAGAVVEQGGLISLSDVIQRLEGRVPEKIGKRNLTDAADALARIGFGVAPDPRYALRSPKPEEPVVLFELGARVEKLEEVSSDYRGALMELALGSFVAHADGRIAVREREVLGARIDAVEALSEQERRRLHANLEWYMNVAPDMTLLRRKLKEVDQEGQSTIRAALIGTAHADGIIHTLEVESIEKVYKTLGLDPALAYSDLHAGEVTDSPSVVRPSQPGRPGEAIPALDEARGPVLDASRIAAIRSDTERVSSVLGQIFDVEEEEGRGTGSARHGLLTGLDPKHEALVVDLVDQVHWSEANFEQLCVKHGLMAFGALEAINEWAFETYEEALLDEYDGYDVSQEIAEAVNRMMQEEGRDVETETA